MTIEEAERELVDALASNTDRIRDATDYLVSCLFATTEGHDPTDGVIFEMTERGSDRFRGCGVVWMIETQVVEPLRVEFRWDPTSRVLKSGVVHFGDAARDSVAWVHRRSTGSRRGSFSASDLQHRIVRELHEQPYRDYDWKACFERRVGGWYRQ